MSRKKSIAIIGGGSAALALASFVEEKLFDVTIYEKNATLGRKFLVAGNGGFNLTHSEEISPLMTRYSPDGFMDDALTAFTNSDFIAWLTSIGIPTFIGSSKRVFPEQGIKPIHVLEKLKTIIKEKGFLIKTKMEWIGWSESDSLLFNETISVEADYYVFCLGGKSWKVTGSDGHWYDIFDKKRIALKPFLPANCAYGVDWDEKFITAYHGKPLKNISIRCGEKIQKGEAVITKFGLEGNAIYALSGEIQKLLSQNKTPEISIDMKPMLSLEEIEIRLDRSNKKTTDILRDVINIDRVKIRLLKSRMTRDQFMDKKMVLSRI